MYIIATILIIVAIIIIIKTDQMYKELESEVLRTLGLSNWNIISYIDECITVKSRQTLEKYDKIRFFKENKENLAYEITNAINNSYSIENLSYDDIGKVLVKIAANYFE